MRPHNGIVTVVSVGNSREIVLVWSYDKGASGTLVLSPESADKLSRDIQQQSLENHERTN